MNRTDPFYGYSVVLRVIVYGLTPAFLIWQFVRLRRALHVLQLEGYKRVRFLRWCRKDFKRSLFLRARKQKKPLVMTARAWRILAAALVLSALGVLVAPAITHITSGWPYDIPTWVVMTILVFVGTPQILVVSDFMLSPLQSAINKRYLKRARAKLAAVDPLVIGVTGSFGKTSTKFAIAGLVAPGDHVLATPASYNTPLGISRAINEGLQPHHKYLVAEMGAFGPGEIAELCKIVPPKISVLTTIGPAHLERFGSLEAIKATKYEIILNLPEDGVAVMNVDDPEVRALADRTEHVTVVRYGLDPAGRPHVTASGVSSTHQGSTMTVHARSLGQQAEFRTRLLGRYAVGHVLAGVTVALLAGRRLEELAEDVAALAPVQHRLELIEGSSGVTVIDDAYNSNLKGAVAALEVLATMPGGKKVVVTPGMVELGPQQEATNERFGELAARVADVLIIVGDVNWQAITTGATRSESQVEIRSVESLDAAQQVLAEIVKQGDVVLFENDLPDQY